MIPRCGVVFHHPVVINDRVIVRRLDVLVAVVRAEADVGEVNGLAVDADVGNLEVAVRKLRRAVRDDQQQLLRAVYRRRPAIAVKGQAGGIIPVAGNLCRCAAGMTCAVAFGLRVGRPPAAGLIEQPRFRAVLQHRRRSHQRGQLTGLFADVFRHFARVRRNDEVHLNRVARNDVVGVDDFVGRFVRTVKGAQTVRAGGIRGEILVPVVVVNRRKACVRVVVEGAVEVRLVVNGLAVDADVRNLHIVAGEEALRVVQHEVELNCALRLLPVELEPDRVHAGAGNFGVRGFHARLGRGLVSRLMLRPPREFRGIGFMVRRKVQQPRGGGLLFFRVRNADQTQQHGKREQQRGQTGKTLHGKTPPLFCENFVRVSSRHYALLL